MTPTIPFIASYPIDSVRRRLTSCDTYWYLMGLWAASMIALPIWIWIFGESSIRWSVTATVVLLSATNILILRGAWGTQRTVITASVVVAMAWLIEYIGSTTGLPFGVYHYTSLLTPQIGHVPLLIPLAWLMMLPPAWAVSAAITGKSRGFGFVLVSAISFTAWDLFLDPQMVRWGFWVWDQPGRYFGIPLLNFAGWFLASVAITFVARPAPVPQIPGTAIYTLTWMLQIIGLWIFWQMPGPAFWGGVGMGIIVLLAWRQLSVGFGSPNSLHF